MSGGSFNYLCWKEISELMANRDTLTSMADRLLEMGYKDAAKETLKFLYTLEQAETRLETMRERLEEVWKAVEWFDSGDWSRVECT